MALTFEQLKTRQKDKGIEAIKAPRKKGAFEKVGGFLAPTATGLLTGEKKLTGRTLIGAGLEIGALAIPSGAILRGFGLAGKLAKGAKLISRTKRVSTAKRVSKVAKPEEGLTFETLRKRSGDLVQKTKAQAVTGAKIGGATGLAFGAGRGLGDEDLSLKEVAGEAAITGAFGAVGGAILTPAVSLTALSAKSSAGVLSNAWKGARAKLNPTDRASAVDDLARATLESFEDKTGTLKKLQTLSEKAKRFEGESFDEFELVKQVVDEGYIPKIRGGLLSKGIADYTGALSHVKARGKSLTRGVSARARGIKETTKSSDIRKAAKAGLIGRTDIEPGKVSKKIDNILSAFEKENKTKSFTATHLNILKIRTGKKTDTFKKEQFIQDSENAIRKVLKTRLDKLDPTIEQLNAEAQKLIRVEDTMRALQNQTIDVGFFSTGAGRFIGTVGGAVIGISVAGPGGLVVASILANLGARAIATIIRQARFNVARQAVIRQGLRSDAKLLQRILKEATPEDAALIKGFVGIGDQRSISEAISVRPKITTANKKIVPIPKANSTIPSRLTRTKKKSNLGTKK